MGPTSINSNAPIAPLNIEYFKYALDAHAIVSATDPQGRITFANSKFCEISKYRREELIGQDHRIINSGYHPKSFMRELWLTISSGNVWNGEIQNRAKDGTYYWVSTTIVPFVDDSGCPIQYISIRTDITALKKAQEAIDQYASIIRSSNDAIISKNIGGIVTSWNPAAERILGYTSLEIIGEPITTIIPFDRLEESNSILERTVRGEIIEPFETVRIRKDGVALICSASVSPIKDSSGKVVGASIILRDISQFKAAEKALRTSEARFQQFADNSHEVFWMSDPAKQEVLYISPAYEKIWGRSRESLYTNPLEWLDAIHSADKERVAEAAFKRQVTGEYDETYRINCPNGEIRWIRDRAYPVRDTSGKVYRLVGTAEDITERHQLEAQLLQAQKMEAIGTLAGGIAHDFNNILGAITGSAELALNEATQHPDVASHLQRILRAGWRGAGLVRQILTFSRQEDREREPINLVPVISETIELLRVTIPKLIHVQSIISERAPLVLADASQIQQIVMNLCTNSVHAMKGTPGVLKIQLENFRADQEFVKANPEFSPGFYAKLEISDTGHGMDAETIKRVFDPFFTTKAPGEGTGLGLAVVHGIVNSHDGIISIESSPGRGAVFQIYLPAISNTEKKMQTEDAKLKTGNGEHVLFVDDEESLVSLGKSMLERVGYFVEGVSEPKQALDLVTNSPNFYDLMVIDYTMPEMTGAELAKSIQKISPEMPIILSSGFINGVTDAELLDSGVRAVLSKPYSYLKLCEKVAEVLNDKNNGADFLNEE